MVLRWFETSVTIYQSTKPNIAEDLKLQQRLMRIGFNKRRSSTQSANFFLTRAVWRKYWFTTKEYELHSIATDGQTRLAHVHGKPEIPLERECQCLKAKDPYTHTETFVIHRGFSQTYTVQKQWHLIVTSHISSRLLVIASTHVLPACLPEFCESWWLPLTTNVVDCTVSNTRFHHPPLRLGRPAPYSLNWSTCFYV